MKTEITRQDQRAVIPAVLQRFSDAARIIRSADKPLPECIYAAYSCHLRDIDSKDLPQKVRFIYDSVMLRLSAVIPHGNIENDEAGHIADDILYLAKELQSSCNSETAQQPIPDVDPAGDRTGPVNHDA